MADALAHMCSCVTCTVTGDALGRKCRDCAHHGGRTGWPRHAWSIRPRPNLKLRGGSDSETRSSRTSSEIPSSRTSSPRTRASHALNFSSILGDQGWTLLEYSELEMGEQRMRGLIALRDAVNSKKHWRLWLSKPAIHQALAEVKTKRRSPT